MRGYILGFLGNFYLKTFKLEKAIKCFEKALKYNTKNVLALYNYGLVLLQNGESEKALTLFEKAKFINKQLLFEKMIILAISSCYWKMGKIAEAIDILEDLKNKYEYVSPEAMTTLGYLYMLDKQYENALNTTKKVLETEPNYASAWDNLGQIYFFQNDLKNAKENFLKSIELNPYSVDSLFYLGLIEEIENNIENAKEYFKRAKDCKITSLNTISQKDLNEKLEKYCIF